MAFFIKKETIMKDLQAKFGALISVAFAAITATVNGAGIDLIGFNSAAILILPGTVTDGTHTPKLQDSPDNSTWTDVAAADQVGTLSAIASGVVQKVGYKGSQRYVRVVSTVSGASTGGVYGAVVLKGDAALSPVA